MPRAVYLYRPGHPKANDHGFINAEDLGDWQAAPPALMVYGESHYDGVRATDGTPIDSRRKRREYMRSRGLADADDFKGVWEKAAKERAAGESEREIREHVARAAHEVESGRRR